MGEGDVDLAVAGIDRMGEQACRRHNHAGLAIAALRHLLGEPGANHRIVGLRRQSLDRRDRLAGSVFQERDAGWCSLPVDLYRAGAAAAMAATELRALETEPVAQKPKQRPFRVVFRSGDILDIDGKSDHAADFGKPTVWA